MITLNNLLESEHIDPTAVLVLRHRPSEPQLNQALCGMAAEHPRLFNAYQQTQSKRVELQMERAKYVASFIGHKTRKALFVGLYQKVSEPKRLTREQYWEMPDHVQLRDTCGVRGFIPGEGRA